MTEKCDGLIAATFSPMRPDGELDLDAVEGVVEHLFEQELVGLFVAGTTGEGMSLTSEERRRLLEAYTHANDGRMELLVHVGHNSVREAASLAEHAADMGATAISATAPSFLKPDSIAAVIESIRPIAEAAPGLPFYYYHIPQLSGIELDVPNLLDAAAEAINSFGGVKFTSPRADVYQACLEASGEQLDVLWGCDELLLSALAVGARRAVGSTYNFAAPINRAIIRAVEACDLATARRWQYRAWQVVQILQAFDNIPASKAVMRMIGVECGGPRTPLRALDEGQGVELHRRLSELGFFEWINCDSVRVTTEPVQQ